MQEFNLKTVNWEQIPKEIKVLIKVKSEESLINFTRIWFQIIKRQTFLPNWHHHVICDQLQDVVTGKNPVNLVLNIPPGAGKTELGCINFQAYSLALALAGKVNHFRSLNISFNADRIYESSTETQNIVFSDQFQELWGGKKGVGKNNHWTMKRSKQAIGSVHSACAGGKITGGRAGYISNSFSGSLVLDDIQKPDDAFSEIKRNRTKTLLTNTILSRRAQEGEKHFTPIINIQQRLHEEDASGIALAGGMGIPFTKIAIPAVVTPAYIDEIEQDRHKERFQKYIDSAPFITVDGVQHYSYWQTKESIEGLLRLKKIDPYTFYSQKQQDPQSMDEKLFDVDKDLYFYDELPKFEQRKVVVDTSSGKEGDYYDKTVILFVGYTKDKICVLHSIRGTYSPDLLKHMLWALLSGEYPEVAAKEQAALDKEIKEKGIDFNYLCHFKKHDPLCSQPFTEIIIEDKQAGQGLIVDIQKKYRMLSIRNQNIKIKPVTPNTSKLVRHQSASPHIRAGDVLFPRKGSNYFYYYSNPNKKIFATDGKWLHEMIEELRKLDIAVLENRHTRVKNINKNKYDDQYDCIMYAIEDKFCSNDNKISATNYYKKFYGG
ncbi:MAG: hypothetical protein GY739_19425 [Mesoflavibacter sp.]|nr:hypothetical protein [Mesoflavibacter sp.]